MRTVDPKIYTKEFYLNACLGSSEFNKTNGKKLHWRVIELLRRIDIQKNDVVLDVGCGRGDITLFLAKNTKQVVGIDYAKDAIKIANTIKGKFSKKIQARTTFKVMNAKKLRFKDNTFDKIICIDVFEHLYQEELEIALAEFKRVLKPNGILFIHAGTNKILYEYTYKYYIRPLNLILTKFDQMIKRTKYNALPKDPRTDEEKEQHVNEPTYHYLKKLLSTYNFAGKITGEIGYVKEGNSPRTKVYNLITTLYPLSTLYPLNTLFIWAFIAKVKNLK